MNKGDIFMVDGIDPKLINGGAIPKPNLQKGENTSDKTQQTIWDKAANAAGQNVANGASAGTTAVAKTGSVSGDVGMGIQGFTVEHTSTAYENGVASGTTTYQYGEQKTNEEDPVSQFKKLDKDGDLKVSAQEYTDNIVEEYVKNGHQLPSQYDNIAEFINDKYQEFLQYAGEDASMNIDEFRNMLIGRLTSTNASKPEQNTPPRNPDETDSSIPPTTPHKANKPENEP